MELKTHQNKIARIHRRIGRVKGAERGREGEKKKEFGRTNRNSRRRRMQQNQC